MKRVLLGAAVTIAVMAGAGVGPVTGAEEPTAGAEPKAYWAQNGCRRPSSGFYKRARSAMHPPAINRVVGKKLRPMLRCAPDRDVRTRWRKKLNDWHRWRKTNAVLLRARRLWSYYKANPMPYCTWANESGSLAKWPEYPPSGRYTEKNDSTTAAGKYQMIDGTFHANGGAEFLGVDHDAAYASPLEQERVGRNVLSSQGIGAWSGC